MEKLILSLIFLFAALCTGNGAEMQLLVTADIHGNLRNFSKLATQIRNYPQAVKADAGDLAQGNPVTDHADGLPMIDALNLLDYDLFIPGNHDFEFGAEILAGWQKRFKGVFLGNQWKSASFTPLPWKIFKRDGISCGIIGMTEPLMLRRQKNLVVGFSFFPGLAALDKAIAQLKRERVDFIVLIRHCGIYSAEGGLYKILATRPEIDAVVNAHSHEKNPGSLIGKALVIQPDERSKSAALLTLTVKDGERIVTGRIIKPDTTPDPAVEKLINTCSAEAEAFLKKSLYQVKTPEKFISDAADFLCEYSDADAALIEAPHWLRSGKFTGKILYTAYPYRNRLFKTTVSPEEFAAFSAEKARYKRLRHISRRKNAAAEKIILVLNDFQLRTSPALKKTISNAKPLALTERQLIQLFFNRQKNIQREK